MPPRLRDDLVAATVQEGDVAYVDVSDPNTGINFRFYDFEYELAKQFTGQDLEAVAAWGSATYGMELTKEALDQFVEKLTGLGFLAGTGAGGAQPAVLSPISPSSGAPFGKNPVALPVDAQPEAVELASAPMFGDEGDVAETKADGNAAATLMRAVPLAPAALSTSASAAGGGPLRLVPPAPPPRSTAVPTPIPSESSAPRALTEGDPTEYRLGDAGPTPPNTKPAPAEPKAAPAEAKPSAIKPERSASANLGRGRTLHGISLAPLLPQAPGPGDASGHSSGHASGAGVLPRLQALGSPLPPLSSQPIVQPVSLPTPVEPKRPGGADETPLTSIAHAIVAEAAIPAGAPTPSHALEAGGSGASGGPSPPAANLAAFTAGIATATVVGSPTGITSPSSIAAPVGGRSTAAVAPGSGLGAAHSAGSSDDEPAGGAWANALASAIETPLAERRQPPSPEVVVMPPMVDKAAMPPVPKRRAPLVVGAVLVAGLLTAAIYATRNEAVPERPAQTALSVHVVAPQPSTYYRWFSPTGSVVAGKDDELSFKIAGKLQDVMPPGTTFSAGEAVARLQGVAARELAVNHARSRLAFVEQLRDSSRASGNLGAARAAEVGIAARKKELADAQTKLSEMEIRPPTAGVIGEVLLTRGALVKVGAPVFRIRATGPRAMFALSPEDRAAVRTLGFCRLETLPSATADAGAADRHPRAIDCTLAPASPDSREPVAVDVVGAIAPGTQVRLASARFDGVFPIPRSAVAHETVGDRTLDRVWLASGATLTAESRGVELAGTVGEQALVSRGLAAGDSVIVDPPAGLINGTLLNVLR